MAASKPTPGLALIGMGTEILVLLGAFIYAGRYLALLMGKPPAVGILIGGLLALVIWVVRIIKSSKISQAEVDASLSVQPKTGLSFKDSEGPKGPSAPGDSKDESLPSSKELKEQ